MINHFTFNGTSTAQLGLIVSGVSIFGAGSRKVEKAGIPGRNGDLQIELGGFNNYTVRYTVSITNDFTTTAQQIREWLLESKGYCELTDTYHPDEIRKACFNSDIEFTTTMLYKYGQASIQFDCLPERYLTTNTPITTTATADTTTDTTMSLSTVPTPINISLNGNTTQAENPTPTNPQPIHNVSGDNTVFVSGKNMWGGTKMVSDIKKALPSATADFTNNTITYAQNAEGNVNPSFTPDITFKTNTDYTLILSVSSNSATNATNMMITYTDGTSQYVNKPQALAEKQVFAFHPNRLNRTIKSIVKVWASGTSTFYADECGLFEGNIELENFEVFGAQSYPIYLPVENLNKIADVKSGWLPTTGAYPTTNGSYPNAQYLIVPLNKGETCYLSGTTNIKGRVRAMNASTVIGTVTANTTYYTTTADQSSGFKEGSITALQDLLLGILFMDGYASSGGNELIIAKGTNVQNYSIELNKIGTYQDYIYKNGGKWYVHKETGKVDLGTLTWSYYSTSPTFMYNATLPVVSGTSSALCDAYPCGLSTDNKTFRFNGQILRIYDPDYSDASAFKTAMNGVMLYYPLATPTNTEITDTTLINQLNNIEKAYSYNGTTNILQVSNDNGFMLGVVSLHGSTFTSNYKGEPIITVNSTGLIYLNGEVMEVLSAPVTINCQTMQCYNGVVNMNNEVRVNDFPEIKIGANEVGSSMALTITPNNWRH